MASKEQWKKYREEINASADWEQFATSLGIEIVGNPTSSGWASCRSIDGDDENPSASFNIQTGYYKDFRDGEKAISPYDLLYDLDKADSFFEAQKFVADMFDIKMPKATGEDPDHGVKWRPWKDSLVGQFLAAKPGITLEGLKAASARQCVRFGRACLAFPVVAYRDPNPIIGWMFIPRDGKPFVDKDGGTKKAVCKTYSDEKGFVSSPDIVHRIAEASGGKVYWCEGAPDMLAGLSAFPNELFVTNCHGCQESVSEDQRAAVNQSKVDWVFIADADTPGIAGASKRSEAFPNNGRISVACPPYDIEEKHGKDYRDFLCESKPKHPTDGLNVLDGLTAKKIQEDREESEREERKQMHESEIKQAHRVLKSVGCMILSVDHGGEIELYSLATKSAKVVQSISNLQYDDMIQFLGFDFRYMVHRTADDILREERGGYIFKDFKRLLALASTDVRYHDCEKVGAGIWAVEDKDHERTGDLLIVKHGEAYKYNGSLQSVESPVVDRMVAKMSERIDWFDPDVLANYIERAKDHKWRTKVYNDLWNLLDQWNWANPSMTELCCGLIFATWTQAVQRWRPMVTVTGESNAGKTVLMQLIEKQFLGLANASARSTAAGVLQSLGDNSQPILLDEFDNGTQQEGLMERFRVASRGQSSLYGTAGQGGKTYKIRHLVWFSGIYAASRSQADMNRMINLRLLQAEGNNRTIEMPSSSEIRDLGHKILAGVIVTANKAVELADRLTEMKSDDETIQSRYRESFSVPYGCLGAFIGLDLKGVNDVMTGYLTDVVSHEVEMSDASTDQDQLLLDILSSEVRLPNDGSAPVDHASVAELLFKPNLGKYRDHARTKGVGYVVPKKGSEPKVAFAGRRLTGKGGLLKGTDWSEQRSGIMQILERVSPTLNPRKEKQVIAGSLLTCVSLDYKALRRWCEGDSDRKRTVGLGGNA